MRPVWAMRDTTDEGVSVLEGLGMFVHEPGDLVTIPGEGEPVEHCAVDVELARLASDNPHVRRARRLLDKAEVDGQGWRTITVGRPPHAKVIRVGRRTAAQLAALRREVDRAQHDAAVDRWAREWDGTISVVRMAEIQDLLSASDEIGAEFRKRAYEGNPVGCLARSIALVGCAVASIRYDVDLKHVVLVHDESRAA